MKLKLSVVLYIILGGVILYCLFALAGYFLGLGNGQAGFIRVSGRIEGTEYHAAAKVAGRVTNYNIEEGQAVTAGEQIATIDTQQLTAFVGQAEAYLRKAEANLKFTETELARLKQLLEDNAINPQLYDESKNRYLAATEDVQAAKKALDKLSVDQVDTKILAPISGRITTKIVQAGEIVGVGTPLVTIINMNNLFLKAFLPTETAGKLSLGDEARISPDALENEAFDAVVSKISDKAEFTPKNVENKSQRANLVFEIKLKVIDNKGNRLKPGMPAEALIRLDKTRNWPGSK